MHHVGGDRKVRKLFAQLYLILVDHYKSSFQSNWKIVKHKLVLYLDVDGGWGEEHLSECSVCGKGTNGTRSLTRTCDNPAPGSQGNICPCNDYIEYESCDGLVATFRTESCADEPCRKLLGS